MTNREYFEKNNVSFIDVLKEFNDNNMSSFDRFLNRERIVAKFKKGDIVVMDHTRIDGFSHNVVFEIVDVDCSAFVDTGMYTAKFLTPDGGYIIGCIRNFAFPAFEKICTLY